MLESGLSGSVRGVPSNGHPYRDSGPEPDSACCGQADPVLRTPRTVGAKPALPRIAVSGQNRAKSIWLLHFGDGFSAWSRISLTRL